MTHLDPARHEELDAPRRERRWLAARPARFGAYNRLEADHGPIKRLCQATLGFKSMKSAYATIKGFEVMRMIRKRQCICLEPGVMGEVRFVAKLFGAYA